MKCDFISFSLGVVFSCAIRLGQVMKTVQHAVRYTVTVGARLYPSRVWDTVTTSAVAGAGYKLALGGSQTCNIWLPNDFITVRPLTLNLPLIPSSL